MRAIARHLSAWEKKNGPVEFGRHKSRAAWWDVLHADYADEDLEDYIEEDVADEVRKEGARKESSN